MFKKNKSYHGGGMYFYSCRNITIEYSKFNENLISEKGKGNGSGFYCLDVKHFVGYNLTFEDNKSLGNGGGF